MIAAAPAPDDRLAAAVAARVRPRFELTPEAFLERVRAVGGVADPERLHLDDLYLATACLENDRAAWLEFEQRYFAYVRAFARRFDLPDALADDVADQVVADLWGRRSIGRYSGRSSLRTWLGAVVTHASLNAAARERRRGAETDVEGTPAPAAEEAEAADALAEVVAGALAALDPPERLLVLLHYEQGLTLDQIGSLEGRSKATMSRALKKVRAELRGAIEGVLAARHGTSWRELRPEVDLGRIDLDLPALLGR